MSNCKASTIPMNTNEKLAISDGTEAVDGKLFRSLVGGLMYLTHIRPDIMFSISFMSRFMHSPTIHHFGAAKRILRYIAGTSNYGIWYSQSSSLKLSGYTDSDWAGSIDDRRSTSGYWFSLGTGALAWSSKKQPSVALSSCEAEYIAGAASACQAVWLRKILEELGNKQERPTEIQCDSASAIALSKNLVYHGRAKHIDIKYHFLRDLVTE